MKTVTSGAHYTTVEVDTAEAVKFSFPSTSLSVEAAGGDITVALTDTAQAGDDETITVPDGESRMFIHHRMNVDTYYLTGSGTAKLYASNMGDVNPFKAGKRGGDGGGTLGLEKVVLWENDGTTNPDTITLSEAITNFDEVVFCISQSTYGNYTEKYVDVEEALNNPGNERFFISVGFYTSGNNYTSWRPSDDRLTLTKRNDEGSSNFYVLKIIGRRYTRVSPTGYREIELYSNNEHAATPVNTVLTLSQNWTDFDAIGFVSEYNDEVGLCAYNEWKVFAISATDRITLNFDVGSRENSFIYLVKASSSSFVVNGLNTSGALSHVYKIIGIKY